ncbi:MAG: sigma-54-dependent transcriptional regulator [Persicimonas sp.]
MSDVESPTTERPILVVDDEQSMREFLSIMLEDSEHRVEVATRGEEAIELLEEGNRYCLIITDLKMPGKSGLDVLKRAKELDPACQVVVMTAYATPETAISAIKEGAYDYITKPFKVDKARLVVDRALEKYDLVSENLYLKKTLDERDGFGQMLGKSEPMRRVFEMISRVADSDTTILISGESGTGKELVARAIHQHSERAEHPFLPINCGAIPENLIESELFGHKKGAFTGASSDKKGLFEAAGRGTVFLDEIGELPQNTQVKLLRVLQEHRIKPVGGNTEVQVDCRVLAATNRELREEVAQGRFREDLYYRLSVIPIELPPLRDRQGDIKLLIEHFVDEYSERMGVGISGVDAEAMRLLLNYPYPGNVRELQNIIERAVTLTRGDMITSEVLPNHLQEESFSRVASELEVPEEGLDLEAMVEQLERSLIEKALERASGVKKDAAELLGISFRSLRYRLKKYGMNGEE